MRDLDSYDGYGEIQFKQVDLVNGKLLFDVTNHTGYVGVSVVAKKGLQLTSGTGYRSPETGQDYTYDPNRPVYIYEASMPVGFTALTEFRSNCSHQ